LPQNFPLPSSTVSQLPGSAKLGRGQNGFAIGLILVVVALLAIVIGAIATGNRGASTVGKQEEERLGASFLLTTGKGFEVQIASYVTANNLKGYQLYAVQRAGATAAEQAAFTNVANLWRPRGGLTPPKVAETSYEQAPIAAIHGAGATQGACALNPTYDTDTNGNGCAWYLSRVNMAIGRNVLQAGQQWEGSSLTNDLIVYTFPLRVAVCQQTNNLLFAAPLSDAPVPLVHVFWWGKLAANDGTNRWAPVVWATPAAAAVDSRNPTSAVEFSQGGIASTTAGTAAPPTINGEPRNEFCANANSGLAAGTNIYTYAKTVYVQ
jgi:hypothetical protein